MDHTDNSSLVKSRFLGREHGTVPVSLVNDPVARKPF